MYKNVAWRAPHAWPAEHAKPRPVVNRHAEGHHGAHGILHRGWWHTYTLHHIISMMLKAWNGIVWSPVKKIEGWTCRGIPGDRVRPVSGPSDCVSEQQRAAFYRHRKHVALVLKTGQRAAACVSDATYHF